jgi:hypothetical protein
MLALGALVWPDGGPDRGRLALVVFDPSGRDDRFDAVYRPLADLLGEALQRPVEAVLLTKAGEVLAAANDAPGFVLAPDGLALSLDRERFQPLAAGRGPAPRNLRPRPVLVWRRGAGNEDRPWRTRAGRTVLGDSLSLAACGVLAASGARPEVELAAGPDPYDHGPVLHAARLGGFDYALVRQWDAERFAAAGLLDPAEWGVRDLGAPTPDIVVMAARDLPRRQRLAAGDALTTVGRGDAAAGTPAARLAAGLERLQLAGFNLLLEPELDQVRGQVRADWLLGPR